MSFAPHWKDENTDYLVEVLLSLQDEDDAYRLLDDLCTISEIKALAQRLQVARMLFKDVTYNTIAANTGASTATISRVKRCLNYGAGGYQKVLRRLKEES
ncbi:MAG: YerC/YecD family TrpR-related protein [Syntrophomonadaceae bacterium]|jgi:TrpR-related protein YerC/YecD|nr:YerC/YecD family TrpR-related protein [Bacillota bacterium]NLM87630.1 DNA-binding transcriptional regulator [Syntrophomonadaceae bacterium]HAA09680.1 DNA-binding transcriptional regulator [Syntrophomonas sp.]HQA49991.1 YerC/YecD family TrpR-related protein [Syntrophomonadaceae bacterium]HQD90559.1 YerC/YecD family TrpR-related protein [Syntrophomonadaceae bacterium]